MGHGDQTHLAATRKSGGWTDPIHDKAGKMIEFPNPKDASDSIVTFYDAWNRIVKVDVSANRVAEYEYDGLNRRTIKRIDSDSDNDIDANDDVRHFYYSSGWQVLEETLDTGSGEKTERQFVWGLRYVDDLVLRDRDTDADGDLDDAGGSERHYVMQDANFNIIALADEDGDVVKRFRYTPYGQRTVLDVDFTDDGDNVSDFDFNYGHQGLMLDAETGFYYNRYLYWLWHLGRFECAHGRG